MIFWVLIHFDRSTDFIPDLGAIDIPFSAPIPNDCFVIPPGTVHKNGETALCCVRERNSSSDIARFQDSIRTNIQADDLVALAPVVIEYHHHGFLYTQIDWDDFTSWQVTETDARLLLPDREHRLPVVPHAIDVLFILDHWKNKKPNL